jgi:hypothetical protein
LRFLQHYTEEGLGLLGYTLINRVTGFLCLKGVYCLYLQGSRDFTFTGFYIFLHFTLIINAPFRKVKSWLSCVRLSEEDVAVAMKLINLLS